MTFADPFYGYSFVIRVILYVAVPAFGVWQFVRLRRALHVFQLEGYKRARFIGWCRARPRRALFITSGTHKKPLVMTGRAWRILGIGTVLSVAAVLLPTFLAHIWGGWPYDVPTWAVATGAVFVGAPAILVAADWLLAPIQRAINRRYLGAARRKLDDHRPVVIAVTGSFGKTSTKFAIARLIAAPGKALATPGSFNTPLGIARTINESLDPHHEFFVVEMGAYGVGEIAELCDFVRPHVGVLTAIGPAHLDRFGSLEAIRRAKYEIVESLPPDGVAVMNVDDPEVRKLADETTAVSVVRYGLDLGGSPDVTASDIEIGPRGTSFVVRDTATGRSRSVATRLLGRHAVGHVLAGVAVGRALGRSLGELADGIGTLMPVEHRLQLIESTGDITVIDDAYNSNPDGADAALDVLEAMPARQKVLVTPGMIELGPLQFDANARFGERAARVADVVIVVARVNRDAIAAGAARAGDGARIVTVDTLEQAQAELADLLTPGAVVLFENDLPDQYEG